MWEWLTQISLDGWVLSVAPVLGLGVGYVIGRILRRRSKLKPVPRPNRIPYDKDTFRK